MTQERIMRVDNYQEIMLHFSRLAAANILFAADYFKTYVISLQKGTSKSLPDAWQLAVSNVGHVLLGRNLGPDGAIPQEDCDKVPGVCESIAMTRETLFPALN